MLQGLFVILLGPSGAGKGTVMRLLKEDDLSSLKFALSTTTRTPRPGEAEGVDYYFWSKEEFEQGIADDIFLEWAQVHNDNYYGTLRSEILPVLQDGLATIKEMDVQGVEQVWQNMSSQNIVTIFIKPPSLKILRQRIVDRAPITERELEQRMTSLAQEMEYASMCDYQIQSEEGLPEKASHQIAKIIAQELQKRQNVSC